MPRKCKLIRNEPNFQLLQIIKSDMDLEVYTVLLDGAESFSYS